MEKIFEIIFDIKKVPTRLFLVITVVGTLLLKFPELTGFEVDTKQSWYIYIVIVYLLSIGMLFTNVLVWIFKLIKNEFDNVRFKKAIKKAVENFNQYEKSVIREFFIYNQDVVELKFEDTTVYSLLDKSVISYCGISSSQSLVSSNGMTTYKLNRYYKSIIEENKPLYIDFPITEEEFEDTLNNKRPSWAVGRFQINSHND